MKNNKHYAKKQAEDFTANCKYIGLKLLSQEHQNIISQAQSTSPGYYEFINNG
jgi:hypothetical protein